MSYLSPMLTLLVGAVKKATAALDRDFNEIEKLQSSVRGYQNFVSRSLERTTQNLLGELKRIRPDAVFVDNRLPPEKGSSFLVTPIDGVANFVRGVPFFATAVAFCEQGEVKATVVYNRATDELYFAEKGNGAYKEGFRSHERLRVSAVKDETAALIAAQVGYARGCAEYTAAYRDLFAESENVRVNGSVSLSLAMVAAGKADVCFSLGNNLNPVLAGLLLVREAGGYVYNLNKKPVAPEKIEQIMASGEVAAANTQMEPLVRRLAK